MAIYLRQKAVMLLKLYNYPLRNTKFIKRECYDQRFEMPRHAWRAHDPQSRQYDMVASRAQFGHSTPT